MPYRIANEMCPFYHVLSLRGDSRIPPHRLIEGKERSVLPAINKACHCPERLPRPVAW